MKKNPGPNLKTPSDAVDFYSQKWYQHNPDASLLNLNLLRELHHKIHAIKSTSGSLDWRNLEKSIESLRDAEFGNSSLKQLLKNVSSLTEKSRSLPEGIRSFFSEKYERYDRKWEKALAGEAHFLGWNFWEITALVKVEEAENFHNELGQILLPNAVLLFVESGIQVDEPSLWKGKWTIIGNPKADLSQNDLKKKIVKLSGSLNSLDASTRHPLSVKNISSGNL